MSMHGYEGASISAIIKASGIQKSSIYWQFDSNAAIAAAVGAAAEVPQNVVKPGVVVRFI